VASQSIQNWNRIVEWLKRWKLFAKMPPDGLKSCKDAIHMRLIISPKIAWNQHLMRWVALKTVSTWDLCISASRTADCKLFEDGEAAERNATDFS